MHDSIPVKQHPLYRTWYTMKERCYNPNKKSYRWYGAKGIKVCSEWKNYSRPFLNWADNNGWEPGLWLDRIDSSKDYCPENCRFITPRENISRGAPERTLPKGIRKKRKRFEVLFYIEGRKLFLGSYSDIEIAKEAYQIACSYYGLKPLWRTV